jgi:1,6-anhydro-N-acetylmuramate kinase
MKTEIRTARIELTDPFAGHYVVIRTNPPLRVFRGLAAMDVEKTLAAFAAMSIESNLDDENGVPIDVTTVEGWAEMNSDVMAHVAAKIGEALKAPKASANGSTTHDLPEEGKSPPTSTT